MWVVQIGAWLIVVLHKLRSIAQIVPLYALKLMSWSVYSKYRLIFSCSILSMNFSFLFGFCDLQVMLWVKSARMINVCDSWPMRLQTSTFLYLCIEACKCYIEWIPLDTIWMSTNSKRDILDNRVDLYTVKNSKK